VMQGHEKRANQTRFRKHSTTVVYNGFSTAHHTTAAANSSSSKEQGARSSWGGSIARRRHLVSVGRHLAGSRFSSSTWVCYAKIWARKSRQRRVHRDDTRKGVFHTPRDRLPIGQVFVSSLGLAYALVFNGKKREGKPQRNQRVISFYFLPMHFTKGKAAMRLTFRSSGQA